MKSLLDDRYPPNVAAHFKEEMKNEAKYSSMQGKGVAIAKWADDNDPDEVKENAETWYFYCGKEITKEEAQKYLNNVAFW